MNFWQKAALETMFKLPKTFSVSSSYAFGMIRLIFARYTAISSSLILFSPLPTAANGITCVAINTMSAI